MKQVGLQFFGKERGQICPTVFDSQISAPIFQSALAETELRKVEEMSLRELLERNQFGDHTLLKIISSSQGMEIAHRILSSDEIWELYEGKLYGSVLDTFTAMIANGMGNLLVEKVYARRDQMNEFLFRQVGRFAAYSSGRIDEFVNHPLIFSDASWSGVVEKEISHHLEKQQERLETCKEALLTQLIGTNMSIDQEFLKTYISSLNQNESSFLLQCVRGRNLNIVALARFIQGKASVLEFPKDGSRLQLFRNLDGQTYLVNIIDKRPAEAWSQLVEVIPGMIVPFLQETVRGEQRRVYSEYVGLLTEDWDRIELPVFLRLKLDKLVDTVLYTVRQLGYGDHRGYRNNYCYYFVDRSSGIPTIDFEKVYKSLNDFKIVVRRIDLDAMRKFK